MSRKQKLRRRVITKSNMDLLYQTLIPYVSFHKSKVIFSTYREFTEMCTHFLSSHIHHPQSKFKGYGNFVFRRAFMYAGFCALVILWGILSKTVQFLNLKISRQKSKSKATAFATRFERTNRKHQDNMSVSFIHIKVERVIGCVTLN